MRQVVDWAGGSTDTALRLTLRLLLDDATYPMALRSPWVAERLAQTEPWTDAQRAQLRRLALDWTETQPQTTRRAMQKALGEEIPDDPIPPQRNALARTALLTRALAARSPAEETVPMTSVPETIEHENDLMTPEYARELAIVSKEMERPPYWFPDDIERLRKATALVAQGKVTTRTPGIYDVTGSKGNVYTCETECPCPQGQKGKSKWCHHLIATVLYTEVSARSGPPEVSLFPAPKTVDERLAQRPPESHQDTSDPEDDLGDPRDTDMLLEPARGQKEDTAMATAPATPAALPVPVPLTLALPRRSISAIVADLSRPLPQGCIATMSQGGQTIGFLHWQTVARLLDTYAPGWHGAVTRIDQVGKAWAITYRLTIPCQEGEISREATGQEDEEVKGYGDSTSNGEAMAFKRAAAKFGVGQWLYDKDQTAQALATHLKNEKTSALAALGKAADEAGLPRDTVIAWLKAQTGAQSNATVPLWAIRALTSHLTQTGRRDNASRA